MTHLAAHRPLTADKYNAVIEASNGISIYADTYTCVMCGEETPTHPRRCSRCGGSFFEFTKGTERKSEEPDPSMYGYYNRRGRPRKDANISE